MNTTTTTHRAHRLTALGLLICTVAMIVTGCASFDDLAPPIADTHRQLAPRYNTTVEQLERGRQVYLTDCARCHSPEAVERYSHDRWMNAILPRMIERTALTGPDTDALLAYVALTSEAFELDHSVN